MKRAISSTTGWPIWYYATILMIRKKLKLGTRNSWLFKLYSNWIRPHFIAAISIYLSAANSIFE